MELAQRKVALLRARAQAVSGCRAVFDWALNEFLRVQASGGSVATSVGAHVRGGGAQTSPEVRTAARRQCASLELTTAPAYPERFGPCQSRWRRTAGALTGSYLPVTVR